MHDQLGFYFSDRSMVKSIVKSLGDYTISTEVNKRTTHVVCGDERRTMNVLRGISLGCWIVSVEWVRISSIYCVESM